MAGNYVYNSVDKLRIALNQAEDLKGFIEWELGYDNPDMAQHTPLFSIVQCVNRLRAELEIEEKKLKDDQDG